MMAPHEMMTRSTFLRERGGLLLATLLCCASSSLRCSPAPLPPEGEATTRTLDIASSCRDVSYALSIAPHLATTQEQPNALLLREHTLYIVESGANAISTYDVKRGLYTPNFIDVGNDKNPYDIALSPDGKIAVIPNYLSGTISIADTSSGKILHESAPSTAIINPSGVAASRDHIHVSDVAFGRGADGFGEGKVHVFDRTSFAYLGALTTPTKNPQYLTLLPDEETLLVTQTGPLGFRGERYAQLGDAGITLLSNFGADAPLEPDSAHLTLPPGTNTGDDPAPGRPMLTSDAARAYFVSATSPTLLSLDLENQAWLRGPENPIRLYETQGDALHAGAFAGQGMLLILSYNQDALYVVDTACDEVIAGPIDLGLSSEDLEGPLAIVSDGALRAYFITSLSKRVGSITLVPHTP